MPRILIVDDEPGIRRSVRKFLERAGYETTECGDGTEALALVEQNTFDLILTDVNMPSLDGPTLARALSDKPGNRPKVVLISGDGEGSLREIAAALGTVGTLPKPFTRDELIGSVERALKS